MSRPARWTGTTAKQVIELLRSAAHDRGATVLIVAHDARIIPYADRVFNLEDGSLHESDEDPSATNLAKHKPGTNGVNGVEAPHYPGHVH